MSNSNNGYNDDFEWNIGIVSGTTYSITDTDRNTIKEAFDKWDSIITDNMIPNSSTYNNGRINVNVKFKDMSGDNDYKDTLAYASASKWLYDDENFSNTRDSNEKYIPYEGFIRINTAKLNGITSNQYKYVIIHEIGHIMTLVATETEYWSGNPIIVYTEASTNDKKAYWTGTNSLKYYRRYFDTYTDSNNTTGSNDSLLGIPIEDMGDTVTIRVNRATTSETLYLNRHWEEGNNTRIISGVTHPPLGKELMTPILSSSDTVAPFSAISIGFLEDYGYGVNYFNGDTYQNKAIDRIIDNIFYVRFESNNYVFSLTENGDSIGIPNLQQGKYYVFKRTSTGGSVHPFNIGTSHRYNVADSNGIKVTFTSTSTSSDYVDNNGVQSILDGEELSFYIPENYNGTLKYYSYSNASKIESFTINPICFYGFVNIKTKEGEKKIKDLKRGDLILTNEGYQPLACLHTGINPVNKLLFKPNKKDEFMVKIPKDFLIDNVPDNDVFVTKSHPLSVKVVSKQKDKDFEYLHIFVNELLKLNDRKDDTKPNITDLNDLNKMLCRCLKKIEFVRKDEQFLYNLIFDKQYEICVGNMKFLSHHPNHFNGNVILRHGQEINKKNRSKKIYVLNKVSYFKKITLEDLLKQKPDGIADKEYLASVLRFD